jgi:hypothetical protein
MNGSVVLLEMDYTIGIKHSYRGQHYILQNALILKVVQMTYTMEHSSPSLGNPAPTQNRHKTTACAGRHMLTVVMLSPRSGTKTRPSFGELNVDS